MRDFFNFGKEKSTEATEKLQSPFSIKIENKEFCKLKTSLLFKKILEGAYSRSEGANDQEKINSIFDSYENSNSPKGLISLVVGAMVDKKQVGLIYKTGVIRIATYDELIKIENDYKQSNKSSNGVLINFKNFYLSDLIQNYVSILHDILTSMNTQVGLSKALLIKINALRGTVALNGKDEPIQQAKNMNEALKKGESVLLDKNDSVESIAINSSAIKEAITLINSLIATDLGVSLSFVNGELTSGMSATGEADVNTDEYGFQNFFNTIFKPICDRLYGWDLQFITDDWRWFSAMADKLIIIENSSILSNEQKQAFANRLIPIKKTDGDLS